MKVNLFFIFISFLFFFTHINAQLCLGKNLKCCVEKINFDFTKNVYSTFLDSSFSHSSVDSGYIRKFFENEFEILDRFDCKNMNTIDSLKLDILLQRYKANLRSLKIFYYNEDTINAALDKIETGNSRGTIVSDINEIIGNTKEAFMTILKDRFNRSVNLINLYKDFLDIKSQFESLLKPPFKAIGLWGYESNSYGIAYYIDVNCISKKMQRSEYLLGFQVFYIDNPNSSKIGGEFSFGILVNDIAFLPSIIFPELKDNFLEPGISIMFWKKNLSFGVSYSELKKLGISLMYGW